MAADTKGVRLDELKFASYLPRQFETKKLRVSLFVRRTCYYKYIYILYLYINISIELYIISILFSMSSMLIIYSYILRVLLLLVYFLFVRGTVRK